jgi:hypothetical protein
MPYCGHCGKPVVEEARFCSSCGAPGTPSSVEIPTGSRTCPFCRQQVDPRASRCPHCAAEIGRLEDCIPCPRCSEKVRPLQVDATNEKGFGTDLAKIALGGGYFLSSTGESYSICPACRTPISYCANCRRVTIATINRKWVGVGRSRSGYQFATRCTACSAKTAGPSCFLATEVFQTSLDANLLEFYHIRDNHLIHSKVGRQAISLYYRVGPQLACWCRSHPITRLFLRPVLRAVSSLSRRTH